MDTILQLGDHVNLLSNGQVVGQGYVHSLDPFATCNFVTQGHNRVTIIIEKAMEFASVLLPYPTIDASTIDQAEGSFVLWNKQDVALCEHNTPTKGCQNATKRQTREGWLNEKVNLWSSNFSEIVAEGYILLAFPDDAFEFGELGEDHVGITISQVHVGLQHALQLEHGLHDMNVELLKWPINQVTFEDGETLSLHDSQLQQDCVEDALHILEVGNSFSGETLHTGKKRKYRMINRKEKMNGSSMKPKKVETLLTFESIHNVSTNDCCWRNCCQHVFRQKIEEARRQYWGQKSSDRVSYVYDMLQSAQKREGRRRGLDMIFNNELVCDTAWFKIHGISRASFHRYKASYEEGSRKACHGNTGIIRKAWNHVEMAKAIIQHFIENNADQMPHKSRTTFEGQRETQLVLSGLYKQQDILREVNMTLSSMGFNSISHSTLSRLWRTNFKHVSLCKSSSFSKCDTCTSIKFALEATKMVEERAKLFMSRRIHMLAQMSCRNLYYSWKQRAMCEPKKYLCIIHDKMDQAKTAIPRLDPAPKSLHNSKQLPISLTGMLTHGHGKGAYGHFALGYWPSGPDFTIGSLARCFRHLELKSTDDTTKIHCTNFIKKQSIFQALLSRDMDNHSKNCDDQNLEDVMIPQLPTMSTRPSSNANSNFNPLPKTFYLQLDNCGGENKNRYVFAFLSMLTAKGIFEMVHLGFLMVGHTHEDIDAMFSRFSERLRTSQVHNLLDLMELLTLSSCICPMPYLMEEIPDFKGFVDGYLCDGSEALVGHKKPLQFHFFLKDGVPIMQYMMNPRSKEWLPQSGIELWKRDANGVPKLPQGSPKALPLFQTLKDQAYICQGLEKYMGWWKDQSMKKNANIEFKEKIQPIITYWESMIHALEDGKIQNFIDLKDGFWPMTRWMDAVIDNNIEGEQDEFEDEEEHYCGPLKDKPKGTFKPQIDIKRDFFVLVRPSDEETYPIWLGVALSDVDNDKKSDNYNRVLVQYWAPICRGNVSEKEQYKDCWRKNWRCNLKDPKWWEPANVVVWSWKTRKYPNELKSIKIPSQAIEKAQTNLAQASHLDVGFLDDNDNP